VPLLTISPSSPVEAEADHAFLRSIWDAQSANAGRLVRFTLHADAESDSWTERADLDEAQLCRLRLLLRSRLFEVWRSLAPELHRMTGSFEVFNPAQGANMGWHRDGHVAGEFIAHYYLDRLDVEAVDAGLGMDWFEVALPVEPETLRPGDVQGAAGGGGQESESAPSDEDGAYALPFGVDDDEQRAAIHRHNFVLFETGPTAVRRLVVFEDARVFHRTPLTAHALDDRLQGDRRRPIARFVFYGASIDGDEVRFPSHRTGEAGWWLDPRSASGGRTTCRPAPRARDARGGRDGQGRVAC